VDTNDPQIPPHTEAVDMTEYKGGGGGGNRLQLNGFKFIVFENKPEPFRGSFTWHSETQRKVGS